LIICKAALIGLVSFAMKVSSNWLHLLLELLKRVVA
jgi:hypothetical protein